MSTEVFYPIEQAEKLIADFENCNLDISEWDHGAHLVVGLYFIANYEAAAYPVIKKHIQQYNNCNNNAGYHDTMTRFWVAAVRHFMQDEHGKLHWTQETLDRLIFDDHLTRRNLWNDYYSEKLMLSEEARAQYVAPDIKDFQ